MPLLWGDGVNERRESRGRCPVRIDLPDGVKNSRTEKYNPDPSDSDSTACARFFPTVLVGIPSGTVDTGAVTPGYTDFGRIVGAPSSSTLS